MFLLFNAATYKDMMSTPSALTVIGSSRKCLCYNYRWQTSYYLVHVGVESGYFMYVHRLISCLFIIAVTTYSVDPITM